MDAEPPELNWVVSRPWDNVGITGIDPTREIYKGTSLNNADHFIAIQDDSMETAPDVRPYFWKLGQWQKGHTDIDQPRELKDRVVYDNELVRAGRELLKSARLEGRGQVHSSLLALHY
jgi:hypothetical protein